MAAVAAAIGYPLLVKAVAGGGGKGHAHGRPTPADLAGAVRAARSEAGAAFGDAAVYLERRLTRPRHIEVQLLGDAHGTVLPFVERECSIQRRHQKVVEETPSLAVSPALRAAMTSAAAAVAQSGRLHQRRHDRVPARRGRPLLFPRDEHAAAGRAPDHRDGDRPRSRPLADSHRARRAPRRRSRAAAARRAATRSNAASTPRIPTTASCRRPGASSSCACRPGPGIRDDSGATAGLDVPIFYDPMISKLVAWARGSAAGDRPDAARARRVSRHRHQDDGAVLHAGCSAQPEFVAGRFHTTYLDEVLKARNGRPFVEPTPADEEHGGDRRRARGGDVARRRWRAGVALARPGGRASRGWRTQARTEGLARQMIFFARFARVASAGLDAVQVEIGGRRAPGRGHANGRRFCGLRSTAASVTLTRRASTRTRCRWWWTRVPVEPRGQLAADPIGGLLNVHVGATPCRGHAQRPAPLGPARGRRPPAARGRSASWRRCPARSSACSSKPATRRRPAAGRGGRSDEDGERAARQPRRHGRRDPRA